MTWMGYWEQGKVLDLIQDLEIESSLRGDFVCAKTDEQHFRSFNTTVLNGNRQLTDRDGGRVFSPDDPCTKTGCPVLQKFSRRSTPCLGNQLTLGLQAVPLNHTLSCVGETPPFFLVQKLIYFVQKQSESDLFFFCEGLVVILFSLAEIISNPG